ncbi:MAG: DUF4956 domain-containing protein [Deltaproteobacteria bacterium]|nr:DUF4956 domain-containing protein [Deltaproteobacteria bacterium]MBW1873335.1 DUF4956 domain-containing protein [Deltaproteobacteria bacterium]
MNTQQTFQQFLATQTPHIGILDFSINMAITAGLTIILALAYVRFGTSISNRKLFSKNLVLIAMTTMLIITIVKSSLALSLGLVGALSIVRFRTPIKEPEELAFLFLSIAIGLGLGAGQRAVAALGFAVILSIICLRHLLKSTGNDKGMHLTLATSNPSEGLLDKIIEVLKSHASMVELRRVDEAEDSFQSDFLVQFSDFEHFKNSKRGLREIDSKLQISFLDNGLL